jgi:7-keto-8-aminopelargonate synthetase-like enzyme
MIPKYTVEYSIQFRNQSPVQHYSTDDPVACEQFVEELLERQFRVVAIRHEGVALERPEFDRLIRNAASMLASRHICAERSCRDE